jgi:hypothetical protein
LPQPKAKCANTSDSNGRNGEAEAAEVEAGAVPHQLNVLGGDEAVEFLAFSAEAQVAAAFCPVD